MVAWRRIARLFVVVAIFEIRSMLVAKGIKFTEDSVFCLLIHVWFIQERRRTKKQNRRLMNKLSDSLQLGY